MEECYWSVLFNGKSFFQGEKENETNDNQNDDQDENQDSDVDAWDYDRLLALEDQMGGNDNDLISHNLNALHYRLLDTLLHNYGRHFDTIRYDRCKDWEMAAEIKTGYQEVASDSVFRDAGKHQIILQFLNFTAQITLRCTST